MNKEKIKFFENEIKAYKTALKHIPWRYEIVKEGKMMIKEAIRMEYSKMKEMLDAANIRWQEVKKQENPKEEELANLEKMIKSYAGDCQAMEGQMAALEEEIVATDRTEEQKVEAGREYLKLMEKILKAELSKK